MNKIFLTLIVLIGLQYVRADNKVLFLNKAMTEFQAQEFAKENVWNFIAFIKEKNAVIVSVNSFVNHENVMFQSEFKTRGNMFCFNTNEILISLFHEINENQWSVLLNRFSIEKNKYIPNVYSLKSHAQNENQLLDDVNYLKKLSFIKVVNVNQYFSLQVTTNDPLYNRQWAIENTGTSVQYNGTPNADMNVDSAWTINAGGNSNLKIAILDSGVDTLHEDLIGNILDGYDGFATDSSDTKGYPTPNFSSDGHGTSCAGIAAAMANNNKGTVGIAYNCGIIPIRIFYYINYGGGIGVQPTTNTAAILNGAAYAWRTANADIMSSSAGLSALFIGALGVNTELIDEEINTAFHDGRNYHGVAMFFSAGNDDIEDVLWPAKLENTIAVGASSMCDERKNPNDCSGENWGSTFGVPLDVVAPGVKISTSDMTGNLGFGNGNYTYTFNGTSAACPNAAGVGALILSVNENLHARDIKSILNQTAFKIPTYSFDSTFTHGSWNVEVGYGRVDAFEALKLAQNYESTYTGIRTVDEAISFQIYPNPAHNACYVANNSTKNLTLYIVDLLGRKVMDIELKVNEKKNISLTAGSYFVVDAQTAQSKKVIVY